MSGQTAPYSPKQARVLLGANARYNLLCGAVRSGKTHISGDLLLKRLVQLPAGGRLILGRTAQSVQRNFINPLRERLGPGVVGPVTAAGTLHIAGAPFYVMGADNRAAAAKLQGLTLVYAAGDEVATWHPEVFRILQSRLSMPGATFDGTTNPAHPAHWLRRTLLDKKGLDVKSFTFALADNPFLPPAYVQNLQKEYTGVYYARYVLGQWAAAEGAVYPLFCDNPARFYTAAPQYDWIQVGVDFGGNRSAHAFVACGISAAGEALCALQSARYDAAGMPPQRLYALLARFISQVERRFGPVRLICPDSAEPTLINGMRLALQTPVRPARKGAVAGRIQALNALMAGGRFFYTTGCEGLVNALCTAVYNPRAAADERLDDGSSDVDTLDAFEYAFERALPLYRGVWGAAVV